MVRIVVGVCGASGSIYGLRLLERLRLRPEVETHLILTRSGEKTLHLETGKLAADLKALANVWHPIENISSPLASGSYLTDGMVIAPCSMKSMGGIAHSLGADTIIHYKQQTVDEYVKEYTGGAGFDAVFDTVGGANLAASFQAARAGGRVACIAARGTDELTTAHGKGLTLHVVFMLLPLLTGWGRAHHGEILRRLAGLVDDGRIRPVHDPDVFPFSRVAEAHQKLESGNAIGKIILTNDLG